MAENSGGSSFIELTANIVSAYVSNNSVSSTDIPNLIGQVHSALMRVSSGLVEAPSEPLKPAIAVKRSVTADHIVCLECGRVEEFTEEGIEARQTAVARRMGFEIREHSLILYGHCRRTPCPYRKKVT